MTKELLNQIHEHDRLSIRAVLSTGGQNPQAALAKAGIVDVVELTVVMGDEHGLSGGILGDGITPNLVAVLETEQMGGFGDMSAANSSRGRANSGDRQSEDARPSQTKTVTMPPAYGLQPLAPIHSRSR